jgi:hypothetical protein
MGQLKKKFTSLFENMTFIFTDFLFYFILFYLLKWVSKYEQDFDGYENCSSRLDGKCNKLHRI